MFIRLFYHLKELYYWSELTWILKQASFSVFPWNLVIHIKEKPHLQWHLEIPLIWFWSFFLNHDSCTKCTIEKDSPNKWLKCLVLKSQNDKDQTGSEGVPNVCPADRLSGYTCWRLFVNHHPAVKKSEPCWSPAWCALLPKPSALISLWIFEILSEFLE